MRIYDWEEQIIDLARSWPRTGLLFDFMNFVSDFKQTILIILPVLIILIWKIGWRRIWLPLFLAALSVLASEVISRHIIKALVMRPRPQFLGAECHASACWGFISSHATNVFGIAVLLSIYDKRNLYWSLPVAVLVSFSRIYLLDHYPLDIIGGAAAGSLVGILIWSGYKQYYLQKRRNEEN